MKKISTVFIFIILLGLVPIGLIQLGAQELEISEVDTNRLLFKGEIDIYFTSPKTVSEDQISVSEKNLGPLEIKAFNSKPNLESGIDFILLIDNSGSMYEESYQGSSRSSQAILALNTFLDKIESTPDRAAVYAFNTDLQQIAPLGSDIAEIRRNLSVLKQPEPEMAYTELYNSLKDITRLFPNKTGRRAVIVLSDGENFSVYKQTETENPRWGQLVTEPSEVVTAFNEAGITLDGINISDKMDRSLKSICIESGGKFHDVRSTGDISRVYGKIRDKILSEYRVTVTAPPVKTSMGEIVLEARGLEDSRTFMVPVLFGGKNNLSAIFLLILLILGLGGIAALYLLQFEKPVKAPQIQSLGAAGKTILESGSTIIGSSRDADMTIAGNPGIDAQHATIINDEASGKFTLVSEKTVRVNNRKVNKKDLKPGDVIRIEGTTIIFDAPENKTNEGKNK